MNSLFNATVQFHNIFLHPQSAGQELHFAFVRTIYTKCVSSRWCELQSGSTECSGWFSLSVQCYESRTEFQTRYQFQLIFAFFILRNDQIRMQRSLPRKQAVLAHEKYHRRYNCRAQWLRHYGDYCIRAVDERGSGADLSEFENSSY